MKQFGRIVAAGMEPGGRIFEKYFAIRDDEV
jgi:hypothetical protein